MSVCRRVRVCTVCSAWEHGGVCRCEHHACVHVCALGHVQACAGTRVGVRACVHVCLCLKFQLELAVRVRTTVHTVVQARNSYVEVLSLGVMVSGGGAFER